MKRKVKQIYITPTVTKRDMKMSFLKRARIIDGSTFDLLIAQGTCCGYTICQCY